MKKRIKGFVGLCLVAALAFGGAGKQAYAFSLYVTDDNGRTHGAECNASIGATSGSAHTASVGTTYCYCSVSASFAWYDKNGYLLYSNGNGAGGMHGAGVTMAHKASADMVGHSFVEADHTVSETVTGNSNYMSTVAFWPY